MKDSARRYHCVYCQTPVVICRACDRGNIYCFNGCSELKRTESQRAANRRHQSTPRGMRLHAARQLRIPHQRDHPFRFIVTAHSG